MYQLHQDYENADDKTNSNKLLGESDILQQIELNPLYAIRNHLDNKKYIMYAINADKRTYDLLPDHMKQDQDIMDCYILLSIPVWKVEFRCIDDRKKKTYFCTTVTLNKWVNVKFEELNIMMQNRTRELSKPLQLGPYWVIGGGREVVNELIKTNQLHLLCLVDKSLRENEEFMIEMIRLTPCAINATLILTDDLLCVFIIRCMLWETDEFCEAERTRTRTGEFYYLRDGEVIFCTFQKFISENEFILAFLYNRQECFRRCLFYCGELLEYFHHYTDDLVELSIVTHPANILQYKGKKSNFELLRANPQIRHYREFDILEVLNGTSITHIMIDIQFRFN